MKEGKVIQNEATKALLDIVYELAQGKPEIQDKLEMLRVQLNEGESYHYDLVTHHKNYK